MTEVESVALPTVERGRHIQFGKRDLWLQSHNTGSPGPNVVAVSGGPGYGHLDIIRFADTGFPTVFFDHIGEGESNTTELVDEDYDEICTVEYFVDQIGEVQSATGIDKAVFIAHSSGGTFTILYALQHPDKVAALILVEPMLSGERAEIDGESLMEGIKKGAVARMRQLEQNGETESEAYLWHTKAFERRHLFGKKLADRKHLPPNLEASEQVANHTIYERMVGHSEITPDLSTLLLRLELVGDLKKIAHIPTLFVGGRTGLITPKTMGILHEAMPGSELAIIENSAHFPHESDRVAFRDYVTDFISRRVIPQAE